MDMMIPRRDLEVVSMTTPSSPRGFPAAGCFFSAPTSPRKMADFYSGFDMSRPLVVPFDWEDKPGTPKSSPPRRFDNPPHHNDHDDDDFAFDIGDKSETASLFAEELFDGGIIKPLKPPPRLQLPEFEQSTKTTSPLSTPRSPRSPKQFLRKAFSPKKKLVDVDPFETAIENARNQAGHERGRRERAQDSKRKISRSLSPFRVSAYPWEEEEEEDQKQEQRSSLSSTPSVSSLSGKSSSSSRKWSLRNFLLFRSASEGGGAKHKDSVKKFSSFFRKYDENINSSIRSTDSSDSSSSSRRRGPLMSGHALHYVAKKAESQDKKKKTFLPYKQGILGRFAF